MTYTQMAALHALCFDTPPPWSATDLETVATTTGGFALHRRFGFLLGRAIAGEAELLTLAVHPRHRRNGIARDLVQDFLTQARQRHAEQAFLEVRADNLAAIALYQTAGFTAAGQRKAYYRAPDGARFDAVTMVCALGAP